MNESKAWGESGWYAPLGSTPEKRRFSAKPKLFDLAVEYIESLGYVGDYSVYRSQCGKRPFGLRLTWRRNGDGSVYLEFWNEFENSERLIKVRDVIQMKEIVDNFHFINLASSQNRDR